MQRTSHVATIEKKSLLFTACKADMITEHYQGHLGSKSTLSSACNTVQVIQARADFARDQGQHSLMQRLQQRKPVQCLQCQVLALCT